MHAWLYSLLGLITDIGDSAVLLAIVATGAVYLMSRGCNKAAFALLFSFFAAGILIALTKLVFLGCRSDIIGSDVHSPSGHAALSIAVCGAYAVILGTQLHGFKRRLTTCLLIAFALVIAFSRVPLGFHSVQEVLIGLLVGSIAVFCAHYIIRSGSPTPHLDVHVLALWLLVVAVLFHGIRLPVETLIRMFAHGLKAHTSLCRLFD